MTDMKDKPRALHAEEIDAVAEAARNVLTSEPAGVVAKIWAHHALNLVETVKQTNHEATADRQTLTAVRGALKCDEGREVESVVRLAEKYDDERRYARRLVDELKGKPFADPERIARDIAAARAVESLGRLFGLDPDDINLADNVHAHVVSLIADKNQLDEFVGMILKPLGVRYEGDMPSAVNEVEAIGTKLALWRDERRRLAEYVAAEYGLNTREPLDVFALVKSVLDQWQAYGQGVCAKICEVLDRELIDGDDLPARVERLVSMLREAEQAKERKQAELAEAQAARDVFVRESCELTDLVAGAGIARGMLAPMVERLVNRATRDAALLRQVNEVLDEVFGLAGSDPSNVIGRVRVLADKSFKKDLAPAESEALGKLLNEAGAPAHGLTLVERVRWLARQRDNYREHAEGRGMYAEQKNREAYEALRASGVPMSCNMREGVAMLAADNKRLGTQVEQAHAVITERFGKSGIVHDALTLVERIEGAARIADIRQENDRIITDTMLELERHWSRFMRGVEAARVKYMPHYTGEVSGDGRLCAHEVLPFVEHAVEVAGQAVAAVAYLSESSFYRPRADLNLYESVVELDKAFEAARAAGEQARQELDGFLAERATLVAHVEPYIKRGDGTLVGAIKRLLTIACTVNEHHLRGAVQSIADLLGCKASPTEVVEAVRDLIRGAAGASETITCHHLLDEAGVGLKNSLAERLRELVYKYTTERDLLDDAFGFGRHPDDDRVGALHDIALREARFKNAIAEALGVEPSDDLVKVAASVRATRNEVVEQIERIKGALGETGFGDTHLMSEAVEMFVAHHARQRERLNAFERAAFDEYMTAREAFFFGVADFDDVDEQGRLAAFDRWYAERTRGESKHGGVDRRKLAYAAFEFGATCEVLSDTNREGWREPFNRWYDEFTGEESEASS